MLVAGGANHYVDIEITGCRVEYLTVILEYIDLFGRIQPNLVVLLAKLLKRGISLLA